MAVLRSSNAIKNNVTELSDDFKATQYDYTVRRYENEARHNQKAGVWFARGCGNGPLDFRGIMDVSYRRLQPERRDRSFNPRQYDGG